MADIDWPVGLSPYRMTYYLKPHVGGAESPLTRSRKRYGLSKPRWICRVAFRGLASEYRGSRALIPPQLDSLIVRMNGGLNRVALWDFRRPYPLGLQRYYERFAGQTFTFAGGETFTGGEKFVILPGAEPPNEHAAAGATSIVFKGFKPGERVFAIGDYFGGDGRSHIIHNDAVADSDGRAVVTFDPPLEVDMPARSAITLRPPSMFTLQNEDAGASEETVGQAVEYTLEFEEDLP